MTERNLDESSEALQTREQMLAGLRQSEPTTTSEQWHRTDARDGDSVLLYTLRQDGWRRREPAMVNDVTVRIERASGSTADIAPIVKGIQAALSNPASADLSRVPFEMPNHPDDTHRCPICAEPFKPNDICASDINEGTCHAECLEGSPVVDLETGEETGGKVDTYPYSEVSPSMTPTTRPATGDVGKHSAADIIAQIAQVASGVGFQANVPALDIAGQIVSILAANPEHIDRFMAEGTELFLDGTFNYENGSLTYRAMSGDILSPSVLRKKKGHQQ